MSDSDTSIPTPPFPPPPTPRPSWRLRYERWVERMRMKARANMVPLCLSGLIFSLLVVYLANSIFILIGPGEAGVLFRRLTDGTDTDPPVIR